VDYETICLEMTDGIGLVTLNRPRNMNALNKLMQKELFHAFETVRKERLKAVIVAGSEKFFAVGADIKEIVDIQSPAEAHEFFNEEPSVFDMIDDFPKPVIAAVSGLALGGGCEIAMACDIRIAADNARFGLPEVNLGLMPGAGGTQRLPRLVGEGRAKALLFTGETISAEEAYRIGLVHKVAPYAELMNEAKEMALQIARKPGQALWTIKRAVNGGRDMDLKSALAYEARLFEMLFSTRDQKEGVQAFVEKRAPQFKDR
jgi:enoyl-CoA hydratase